MHEVLVNRLGGLSLPRKSVVRLTDRPDMTLDVYRGRKTTIQYNTECNLHEKDLVESSWLVYTIFLTQAFEIRCHRRLLNILYKDHVTKEEVYRQIHAAIGEYDELLAMVKKRKLRSSAFARTILQGTVEGREEEVDRRTGRMTL